MAIIRWDPYRDIMALRERMNRLFNETFQAPEEEGGLMAATWAPSVDVRESETEYVIAVDLPGVSEKDVDIEIEDRMLSLRGRREFERETRREDYQRIERAYGTFYRAFALPSYVDENRVDAEFDNGVLRITLPKKPESKPKKIEVRGGEKRLDKSGKAGQGERGEAAEKGQRK